MTEPATIDVVERYIQLTNSPGSPSFELFGDTLEWLEVHSGRGGGRVELFAAMKQSRDLFSEVHFEKKSLVVDGETAALEGIWFGRMAADQISVPVVFLFEVRGGKIIREIDYIIMRT